MKKTGRTVPGCWFQVNNVLTFFVQPVAATPPFSAVAVWRRAWASCSPCSSAWGGCPPAPWTRASIPRTLWWDRVLRSPGCRLTTASASPPASAWPSRRPMPPVGSSRGGPQRTNAESSVLALHLGSLSRHRNASPLMYFCAIYFSLYELVFDIFRKFT